MKKDIHPDYAETTISCICGNTIKTRSTKKDIHVEVCSKCHPLFTGRENVSSKRGRVEKFKKKYSRTAKNN
jgi:large subunit ribosomal protein L31